MVVSTSLGVMVMALGLWAFWDLLYLFAPQLTTDGWFPSAVDWLEIAVLAAIGAGLAFFTAVRLGRRVVGPLTSVAASIQRIAAGDLSARAIADKRSSAEGAQLVDSFNEMAANLERASQGLVRWNALIAHELRTPVTILQGRLQGLAQGVFRPDADLYQSLLAQVEGLGRLVEDLRTISLSDAGRLDLVIREVDLARELKDVIRLMEPSLAAAGFSLSLNLASVRSQADPVRLRQALLALLHNALRHADPGELRIELTMAGSGAEITVADRGPGLDPEFARRAFLPFERHSSAEGVTRGSGLGLAVVRAVAEAHGGTVLYENRDGGSCFRMRFGCNRSAHLKSGSARALIRDDSR